MVFAPRESAASIGWEARDDFIENDASGTSQRTMKKRRVSTTNIGDPVFPQRSVNVDNDDIVDGNFDSLPAGITIVPQVDCELSSIELTFDATNSRQFVTVIGIAAIAVLQGSVEILGFTCTKESGAVAINSPDWMSTLCIEPIRKNDEQLDTKIKLQSMSKEYMTFRILSPGKVRSHIFISNKWKHTITSIIEEVPKLVAKQSEGEEKLKTIEKPGAKRILICGAKGVGKSTMLRYLTNRSLSHGERNESNAVAILDIDVGQPEFSPPGMLSLTIVNKPLLSPPHAHIVCNASPNEETAFHLAEKHIDAYYFGYTSSKSNPVSYLKAVNCLVKTFEAFTENEAKYGKNLPLLVNTDGWVKGMGFEILSSVIDVINPNHIVQICGHSNAKKFDIGPHLVQGRAIHVVDTSGQHLYTPPPSRSTSPMPLGTRSKSLSTSPLNTKEANVSISPSSLRSLRLLTYFLGGNEALVREGINFDRSGIVNENNVIASKMSEMRPYVISFHSLYYQMSDKGVFEKGCDDNFKRISGHLNGCIIGLCAKNNRCDQPSCIGLGIVRGVHKSRKLLFVLTPLSKERLGMVNILVSGKIKTPLEMLFRSTRSESFFFQSCDGMTYAGIDSEKINKTGRMRR